MGGLAHFLASEKASGLVSFGEFFAGATCFMVITGYFWVLSCGTTARCYRTPVQRWTFVIPARIPGVIISKLASSHSLQDAEKL